MDKYLIETKMLNFNNPEIAKFVQDNKLLELSEFERIGYVYDFVQNKIIFGYNKIDTLTATQVLKDGYGQCNTKATLLMALLRSVNIPCRLHGTEVTKEFQKGLMSKLMIKLAPKNIVHTWVEVFFNDKWIALEGVITDKKYIEGLKKLYPEFKGKFFDYAVAVENFENLNIDWIGNDTFVQSYAVVKDLGTFNSPDEFWNLHKQTINGINNFLYPLIGRKIMTNKVDKIRKM